MEEPAEQRGGHEIVLEDSSRKARVRKHDDVTLYHFPLSLDSQKVRLALAEKNVKWRSRVVNLVELENLEPWHMRLNPNGVVPTLVVDGDPVTNSLEIVRYINDEFPGHALAPLGEGGDREMASWMQRADSLPLRELTYATLSGLAGRVARRSLSRRGPVIEKQLEAHPDLAEQYAAKLEAHNSFTSTVGSNEKLAEAKSELESAVNRLEQRLKSHDWLVGESYSLADIVWTPTLHRMSALGFDELWKNGRRPAVEEYFSRMKERPSFKKAISDFATTRQRLKVIAPRLVPMAVTGAMVVAMLTAAAWLIA